jgi:hypothetical protein
MKRTTSIVVAGLVVAAGLVVGAVVLVRRRLASNPPGERTSETELENVERSGVLARQVEMSDERKDDGGTVFWSLGVEWSTGAQTSYRLGRPMPPDAVKALEGVSKEGVEGAIEEFRS